MKKLILGLSVLGVMLLIGCSSKEDKYIGSYSSGIKGIITISKNGKCTGSNNEIRSCKWNVEDKQILISDRGGMKHILNIVNVDDDALIVTDKSKWKMYKIGGKTWNSIVGRYKCSSFRRETMDNIYISLKMDGSYKEVTESYDSVIDSNWGINATKNGRIELILDNNIFLEYKNDALYHAHKKTCQKI